MRMTPRVAGAFGRVGFRANSPRIAPGPMIPPGEDEFVFEGHIQDQTYKFTPKNGALVVLGFFGRHTGAMGPYGMTATYNGLPMTVLCPTYVGEDRGIPGFFYIENVTPDVEGEVVVTMTGGQCHSGAMKLMNPIAYTPIDRAQSAPWSGNGGAGGAMQVSPKNVGVEQVLHVGGYGGVRTPIALKNAVRVAWIKERQNLRVESTVTPDSVTSVMFAQFETSADDASLNQSPNNFIIENGYGLAMFCAKSLGLTPP